MKTPINVDDILFKVLQQKTGENNVDQFLSDALQQQLGVEKVCYEMEDSNWEEEFDAWLGDVL
ncbi:hypothetical protein QUF74_07780 [Candidatus Halobeggiatoa sp. HSG11]|nr:hypothetical protein [Candidatus Halobeggiatoa sp. HSG11]